jgi:hypothetical protein
MIWDENLKALRAAIVEDCAAEMTKTHEVDPTELSKQLPGGRMEQKKIEHSRRVEARDSIQAKGSNSSSIRLTLTHPNHSQPGFKNS